MWLLRQGVNWRDAVEDRHARDRARIPDNIIGDLRTVLKALDGLEGRESMFGWYTEDTPKRTGRVKKVGLDTPQQWEEAREALLPMWQRAEDAFTESEDTKKIRELTAQARWAKIPDYFPTPKVIIDQMMEMADIQPGDVVLEPSAGKGDIAEALKAAGADVIVGETSTTLREILSRKGFELGPRDFLEHSGQYNKIVQNPPFGKGADIDHVRHAYAQLAEGGRLVSVTSEGPFFREDRKATAFRAWLDSVDGYSVKLPAGSFKSSERPTGVATRLVVIDR